MSLNWSWSNKCGEVNYEYETIEGKKETTFSLYEGNAFLIFINEYKEDDQDMYTLWSFWADETHAKRMLGLDKKYPDTYGNNSYENKRDRITKFRLNKAKSRNWKKIVKLLAEAFDNVDIELYTEGE